MIEQERTIVIATHFEPQWQERVQQLAPDYRVMLSTPKDQQELSADILSTVEVMYTFGWHLPEPEQVPNLRWIQLYSAGANQAMPSRLYRETDVLFTTASGVHAVAIGEYVLLAALAWFHRLPTLFAWQQEHSWPHNAQRTELFRPQNIRGKTIGIVGYGSIGREVARQAKAHGMRVLAMQRGDNHRDTGFIFPDIGDPEGVLPDRYYTMPQLHEMLSECDVVVASMPLTDETRSMFNAQAFNAMKPETFFINIARGDVVDEVALLHALSEKQLAGAALDVFHQEPLPSDSLFWQLPNVIISPHVTGIFAEYDQTVAQIFEANLQRYLQSEPLYNLVDKTRGY